MVNPLELAKELLLRGQKKSTRRLFHDVLVVKLLVLLVQANVISVEKSGLMKIGVEVITRNNLNLL